MKKGTVAVSVISIAAFCVLAYLVTGSYTQSFDDAFRDMVYALRTSVLTFAAKGFSYAGDIQGVGAACIIFLIVPVTRKKLGIPVAAVVVVTQCAKKVIKMLITRPRPPLTDRLVFEDGFSFPSGHSITSMAICILAVYFIQTEMKSRAAAKVLSIFIILFGIGIGASRIYLGVHYPTDVLGAWLLSSAAAFAAIAAIQHIKRKSPERLENRPKYRAKH